jgi:hypothetical protein
MHWQVFEILIGRFGVENFGVENFGGKKTKF